MLPVTFGSGGGNVLLEAFGTAAAETRAAASLLGIARFVRCRGIFDVEEVVNGRTTTSAPEPGLMPGPSPSASRSSVSGFATAPLPSGVEWIVDAPMRVICRVVCGAVGDAPVACPCVNAKASATPITASAAKPTWTKVAFVRRPDFLLPTPICCLLERFVHSYTVEFTDLQRCGHNDARLDFTTSRRTGPEVFPKSRRGGRILEPL